MELNPHLSIQYLTTFLKVVEKEGQGVGDYATAAGVGKTIMTRCLLDIGERDPHGGAGFGLIYQKRDPRAL